MQNPLTKGLAATAALVLLLVAFGSPAIGEEIARRHDGKPDLSGTYNTATLTPLSRPARLGDKATFTEEEAEELAKYWAANLTEEQSDPDREAPPEGGVEPAAREFSGAAGGVGGYNSFYVDLGDSAFKLDGLYRSSIVVDPPNGRLPKMTAEAMERMKEGAAFRHANTGEAWWAELPVGPYDDPELRPTGERCLLGFGSVAGPPSLPVMYNNLKRIIQTDDTVSILVEMNHDARIVRLNSEHKPDDVRSWLGDSIGWWEGDTLVVETTNFNDDPAMFSATRNLKVTERISRIDADTLRYKFTVEDPSTWSAPWTGEYPWPASDKKMYEYACHEGNYSLGGILRGARLLEEEAAAKKAGGSSTGSGD